MGLHRLDRLDKSYYGHPSDSPFQIASQLRFTSFPPTRRLEQLLNLRLQLLRCPIGRVPPNNVTFPVDEEFGEVPAGQLCLQSAFDTPTTTMSPPKGSSETAPVYTS